MEELQRYECLCNKFSKDYKTKEVRDNFWTALGEKFKITAEEADKNTRAFAQAMGDVYERQSRSGRVLGGMPCLLEGIWSI